LAVGDNDNHIGRKPADLPNGLWILDSYGLKDRRAWRSRPTNQRLFYGRRFNALLAADWLIRLRNDRNNVVFGLQ
jgi:hypothetical protein